MLSSTESIEDSAAILGHRCFCKDRSGKVNWILNLKAKSGGVYGLTQLLTYLLHHYNQP